MKRNTCYLVTTLLLGSAVGIASPARAQEVANADRAHADRDEALHRVVTVNLVNVSVKHAIRSLAASAKVDIQYQSDVVDIVGGRVTLRATRMSLGDALEEVLQGTGLTAVPVTRDVVNVQRIGSAASARIEGGIAGTVVDAQTKGAVAGATVTVNGTKMTVRTDERGAFRLNGVPAGTYVLVVRRLGYSVIRKTVTVSDNSVTPADMTLAVASTPLDEVVTTVTGPQRKVEVANAIGVIKADSLMKEAPITTLSQLLTSRVPGLTVSQGQGTVGGNVRLQIRGLSSITQSTEPIVIIDGIRFDSRSAASKGVAGMASTEPVSPLNDLNPNDIETVEVVKGPSAATLYGTDASNGVIVITTKRGKAGPTRFTMYGSRDINEIPREPLPNDKVYYGWGHWNRAWSTDTTSECDLLTADRNECVRDSVTFRPSINTDPSFSFFKPATSYTSGGNVSGGSGKLRYFAGASYNNLLGALSIPDTVIRYMRQLGRPVPSSLLHPNTQTMLNVQANASASPLPTLDVTVSGNYVRSNTHSIRSSFSPWTLSVEQGGVWVNSPMDRLKDALGYSQFISIEDNDRYVTSANGRYAPTTWFSLNGTTGFDNAARAHVETMPNDSATHVGAGGEVRDVRGRTLGLSATGGASINIQRGWASFRTSVGTQYHRSTDDNMSVLGSGLPTGTRSLNYAVNRFAEQQYDQSVSLGSYLEEVVGLDDRLFLTAAVRTDGATGFGDGYKSATYPKFGLSWLLSKEPWFPRLGILGDLRFRTAYGVSGRQARAIAKLPNVALVSYRAGFSPYFAMESIGNPQLRPERSREIETGIDAGFFEQRATMGLTWYNRETKDLIILELQPSGFGFINRNVALVTGHGFEAHLSATVLDTRNASLSVTMSHAKDQTLLKSLGTALPSRSPDGGYDEGYPLGARFARPVRGYLDKNGDGVLGMSSDTARNEIFRGDTMVYLGPTQAPLRQNMTVALGLFGERIRVSSMFDREAGGTNVLGYPCDRCRAKYDPTTPLDEQFAYIRGGFYGNPVRADVVRLGEITTLVRLPMSFAQAMRINTLSMSVSARNLKRWSSFRGADPQSVPISQNAMQKSGLGIPQARTWTVRFDLGL